MNSSLPIAVSPTHRKNDPVPGPLTSRPREMCDNAPFDQGRWDAWVTKGRLADAAFTEKVRTLALLGVTVAAGLGSAWAIFG